MSDLQGGNNKIKKAPEGTDIKGWGWGGGFFIINGDRVVYHPDQFKTLHEQKKIILSKLNVKKCIQHNFTYIFIVLLVRVGR